MVVLLLHLLVLYSSIFSRSNVIKWAVRLTALVAGFIIKLTWPDGRQIRKQDEIKISGQVRSCNVTGMCRDLAEQ
jgi:hypothetical protein